jgi:hypothetical protein
VFAAVALLQVAIEAFEERLEPVLEDEEMSSENPEDEKDAPTPVSILERINILKGELETCVNMINSMNNRCML